MVVGRQQEKPNVNVGEYVFCLPLLICSLVGIQSGAVSSLHCL